MSIAERHAAERDAALQSVAEHRALLGELNGRAGADREALQADLAVARVAEFDARDKAQLCERQLNEASEREKQLMNRLTAELIDKAAGAEALAALEARCADAEARIETTTSELNQARAALTEASAERVVLVSTAQAAEAAAVKADERLAAIGREERERREALAASLRGEAVSRHAALEDEVRTMEATIADLHHQLGRAARERGRSSDGLGSARYGGDAAALTLALLGASGASALALPTLTAGAGGSRAMDEMASRLAAAERERDTIEQQRRTLAMQLRSVSDGQASERAAASARAEQTQRQLRRLEEETGSLRQERARLLGQVAELEQQLHASQTELRQLCHMSAEEKRIADEASSAQVASLQHQLSDARALHDQSASEVEELLRSQEDLAGRYRDEAKRLAERSESLVNELRAESERLTVRNAELAAQLAQQHRLTDSLERSERERSAQLVLAQQKLKETTLLRSQQSARLAQLQAAEAAWQTERKVLLRQARADHAAATATLAPPRASAALALADAGQVGATSASVRRKAARDIKATAALEVEQALAAARLAQRQPPAVTAE